MIPAMYIHAIVKLVRSLYRGESDPAGRFPTANLAPILNKSERGSLKTQPFLDEDALRTRSPDRYEQARRLLPPSYSVFEHIALLRRAGDEGAAVAGAEKPFALDRALVNQRLREQGEELCDEHEWLEFRKFWSWDYENVPLEMKRQLQDADTLRAFYDDLTSIWFLEQWRNSLFRVVHGV